MALSPGNASGVNKRNVAALAASLGSCATAMPKAVKVAADRTAMKVKPAWYGILESQANLKKTTKLKGRPWSIRDSVKGDTVKGATILIGVQGPVWLVVGPTKAHSILPRRLGKSATVRTRAKFKTVKVAGLKVGRIQTQAAGTKARAGKLALYFPGAAGPRASAFHRGTKGHREAWPAMKKVANEIGPATFRAESRKALAMEFGKSAKQTGGALL